MNRTGRTGLTAQRHVPIVALATLLGASTVVAVELVQGTLQVTNAVEVSIQVVGQRFQEGEELQRWAEEELASRGLWSAAAGETTPTLRVMARVTDDCVYVIESWLSERAKLLRKTDSNDEVEVFAATWEGPRLIGHAPLDHCRSLVDERIKDLVKEFADTLLAARREIQETDGGHRSR